MEIRLLKAAQLELDESFIFYEDQVTGLGYEFVYEVEVKSNRSEHIQMHGPNFLSEPDDVWLKDSLLALFIK